MSLTTCEKPGAPACADCHAIPSLTSQCTDHDQDPVCECPGNHCDLVCEDASSCQDCNGFDEFLQCCTDFHSYYEEPRNHPETTWSWDPSLKTFVSALDPPLPVLACILSGLAEHVNLSRDPCSMSCQWKNCNIYPTPDLVPGPSSGDIDSTLCVLSSHLLHDHLGLPPCFHGPHSAELLQPESHHSAHEPTVSSALPPEDDGPAGHVCCWSSCGQSFGSLDDLTQHLTDAHVGSGKTSYDCYWQDCPRHGESGFTSKQKLCRHLQSHTGHRPFQCKICLQNFSEAATLQQHMRRHTQEKPYLCDYPGCGKSFAITGALTIHKRTHNGEKPFKCPRCDKQLRTHTGSKPYTCETCNKSFARVDQLTRHTRFTAKKSLIANRHQFILYTLYL
ncbi:hypothetical protein B0H13DRAFT_2244676 [Mycena leptocephala]|nr:hypothetical protein B0H13DRAFT_2244676 [Mycena leptocephala]